MSTVLYTSKKENFRTVNTFNLQWRNKQKVLLTLLPKYSCGLFWLKLARQTRCVVSSLKGCPVILRAGTKLSEGHKAELWARAEVSEAWYYQVRLHRIGWLSTSDTTLQNPRAPHVRGPPEQQTESRKRRNQRQQRSSAFKASSCSKALPTQRLSFALLASSRCMIHGRLQNETTPAGKSGKSGKENTGRWRRTLQEGRPREQGLRWQGHPLWAECRAGTWLKLWETHRRSIPTLTLRNCDVGQLT